MARIPASEVERLKQEIALVRLVESAGVNLKPHGADRIGRCPFHDDKTPSLVVSPKKNLWHCLGACQAGGTVIDWVMKTQGVSFRHAVEILQNDLPLTAPRQRSTVPKLPSPVSVDADDQALLTQVIDYYHETLKQSPETLEYLERRGLKSAELVDTFKLGFANRTLGYRLPAKNRRAGAAVRGRLQRLGVLRASGHEHFNGSLVIPVIDENGLITEVYGRKITAGLRKGTPLHLYLPGPHAGVFNAAVLPACKEIILCESLIDALTFWAAGYRNVTASYGTAGFTDDHLAAFTTHGVERILIAYDRDQAGNTAAQKLAEKLTAAGLEAYRIEFPKGMDANEYALKVQPASKSLGVVIRSAVWLGKGEPATKRKTTVPILAADPADAAVNNIAPTHQTPSVPALFETESVPELLPAAAVPPAPRADIAAEVTDTDVVIGLGDRRYRIRGLDKNLSYEQLKLNILVSRADGLGGETGVHVDTFDLYQARPRTAFIKHAAVELGVGEEAIKADVGKLLLKLEALQDEQIQATLKPAPPVVTMSETEREAALALLKSPDLIERIVADFARCGVVGEQTNTLVGYLAAVSRKLDRPLAIVIQSSSSAGKSALMDAVLAFLPGEARVKYSAMTGQSLFYMGETDLKHKCLAIVEEEGATHATYALKLLQSEGELTIASTGKDPNTGQLVTHQYRVEGPVMIMLTTTAVELDEELMNRCLVLSVNEDRDQTQAIHRRQRQRRTLSGLLATSQHEQLLTLHQNAQRLLEPLAVVNPYAEALTFLDDRTRTRRDHEKYLTLIDAIALLHQHQRSVKTLGDDLRYVEVTLADIELANRLAHEVLGRCLDELPPQTRRLLRWLDDWVTEQAIKQNQVRPAVRFTRRELRDGCEISDTQLKVHLARLVELEYLLVHRGGRGQSFVYELLYDGAGVDHTPHLNGLIDVDELVQRYDGSRSASAPTWSGSGRPVAGGQTVAGRDDKSRNNINGENALAASAATVSENTVPGGGESAPSYRRYSV